MKYLQAARKTSTPLVIGTTGFSDEQERKIKETGDEIPILKASNFSPSINVMRELVREAAGKLEDYDIEVTETHHNRKRDASSGTTKAFLEEIRETRVDKGETFRVDASRESTGTSFLSRSGDKGSGKTAGTQRRCLYR
jgi:4-hydroxy-tetrahydrodipicolinate reductase